MTNYRGPSKNRRSTASTTAFQQWVEQYLQQNQYVTENEVPSEISAFINDMGYINTLPFIPTKLSQLINDSGYLSSAPVVSVNGKTGAVQLALFSGVYNDLTGKPALFSGNYVDLLNKPVLFSGAYSDLTGKPLLFSGDYPDLTNKPTIPTVRRMETFFGTTDASGNYTVTYSTPYPTVPLVNPHIVGGTASQVVRITSSTTTGFTINVTNRSSVTLLAVEVLLAATVPVSGASVSVFTIARS